MPFFDHNPTALLHPAAILAARQGKNKGLGIACLQTPPIVSGSAERLWNTFAILIPGANSRKLVAALDRAGTEASTGSACNSGDASAARVVAAITPSLGLAPGTPAGMVRFSAGPDTTAAD